MSQPQHPWPETARNYLAQIDIALRAVHEDTEVPFAALVWPAGLNRSTIHWLPVSVRTWNCFKQGKLMDGDSPLSAEDVLRLRGFGRLSLKNLLFNVENFLLDCVENDGASFGRPLYPADEVLRETETASIGAWAQSEAQLSTWNHVRENLLPLLATSADLLGTLTLADALPEILHLASRMKLTPTLDSVEIRDIVERTQSLPKLVAERLHRTLETASVRQRAVIQARLIQAPPARLEEVGLRFDISHERVRQIQSKLQNRIKEALGEELGVIAATLKGQLGPMVPEADLDRRIEGVVPNGSPIVYCLFRKALIREMGFALHDGIYVDERVVEALGTVCTGARALADDVGLVDERQLIETLPGEGWQSFWPWLCERSGLHRFHGMLALRDTARARAKAALMSIGRSATREEIASLCRFEDSGIVGSTLSNVASVVRADKDRWGLREWIDDEYDGIVGEIVQRIEEDGGATTTERLLAELPRKFNVSPVSVRTYMKTPKFEIRDGSIRLADVSAIRLRDLDDVIHGRDDNGAPYWTFIVESRHFKGYSVFGVPPEFAKALGCSPDSGSGIRIENLADDRRKLSLRWRLSSQSGATLGYLSEPFRQLGLRPGDRARVTIKGPGLVDLRAQDTDARVRRSRRGRCDALSASCAVAGRRHSCVRRRMGARARLFSLPDECVDRRTHTGVPRRKRVSEAPLAGLAPAGQDGSHDVHLTHPPFRSRGTRIGSPERATGSTALPRQVGADMLCARGKRGCNVLHPEPVNRRSTGRASTPGARAGLASHWLRWSSSRPPRRSARRGCASTQGGDEPCRLPSSRGEFAAAAMAPT